MDRILGQPDHPASPIRLLIWRLSFIRDSGTGYASGISPMDECRAHIQIGLSHSHDARGYDPRLRYGDQIDRPDICSTSRCILYAIRGILFPRESPAPSVCAPLSEKISADRSQFCSFSYRSLSLLIAEVRRYQVSPDIHSLGLCWYPYRRHHPG